MALVASDANSTNQTLASTVTGNEHIVHHRDTYVEALIGPRTSSIALSPSSNASVSELLRGFWSDYLDENYSRLFNWNLTTGVADYYKSYSTSAYINSIVYSNLTDIDYYLLLWNEAFATTIPAGKVPLFRFPMWSKTGPVGIGADIFGNKGLSFPAALTWAISSSPTGYTAVTSGNIFVELYTK